MDKRCSLAKTRVSDEFPLACSDELAAVEFLEKQRWGASPSCIHCGGVNVYKMVDSKTGQRSRRYLWRCRECKQQYTVRIGTIYEESRIELRHWCYAFRRASTSKKGVSALEIKRHCQISYKSALFLMNRIRFAIAADDNEPELTRMVECGENSIAPRKPRYNGTDKGGRGTSKTPIFVAVEGEGKLRRPAVTDVTTDAVVS